MEIINPNAELYKKIIHDRRLRRTVTQKSFYWFFNIYFPHYVKYETAEFQKEIFRLLEDEDNQLLVFVAFRGSGKSTIITMAYVLWAILGMQSKKYVIIAGQTQRQARQFLQNIKQELESNPILRSDLGPFKEEPGEWGSLSLIIQNHGAKIAAASTEQSIRGMRHGASRPDLIICDDVEDLNSVQTMESREKTERWFAGEVQPSGDLDTRIVVVGNLLHEDSLMMRLQGKISNNELSGIVRKYSLIDDSGNCLWPGKYPNQEAIDAERRKIGNYNAWMREFMLAIIPEEGQVILPEWITYYDDTPPDTDRSYRFTIAAADLAISQKENADYTAIVTAKVFGWGKEMRIYILPYPVNKRLIFPQQLEMVKQLSTEHDSKLKILIEANGYQRALVQELEDQNFPVLGVVNVGNDKHARLSLISPQIKNSVVLFPKIGAEPLIRQLVGMGVEKHDDLADAFTMLVDYCVKNNKRPSRIEDCMLEPGPEELRPITAGLMDEVF